MQPESLQTITLSYLETHLPQDCVEQILERFRPRAAYCCLVHSASDTDCMAVYSSLARAKERKAWPDAVYTEMLLDPECEMHVVYLLHSKSFHAEYVTNNIRKIKTYIERYRGTSAWECNGYTLSEDDISDEWATVEQHAVEQGTYIEYTLAEFSLLE